MPGISGGNRVFVHHRQRRRTPLYPPSFETGCQQGELQMAPDTPATGAAASSTAVIPGEMAARIDRLPVSWMQWELACSPSSAGRASSPPTGSPGRCTRSSGSHDTSLPHRSIRSCKAVGSFPPRCLRLPHGVTGGPALPAARPPPRRPRREAGVANGVASVSGSGRGNGPAPTTALGESTADVSPKASHHAHPSTGGHITDLHAPSRDPVTGSTPAAARTLRRGTA